jgi:hypothetical protein
VKNDPVFRIGTFGGLGDVQLAGRADNDVAHFVIGILSIN